MKRPQLSRLPRLPAALAATLILCSCGGEPDMLELRGQTMGTSYSVRIVAPADATAVPLELLRQRVAARLEDLENVFSTYRPDSEVSRFNARPGQEWFGVSPEFLDVLEQAVTVSQLTDGAFDATIGRLVELWGFGAGDTLGRIPDREVLEQLLSDAGIEYLQFRDSPPTVRRTRPGVQLDFSAIAKGYAVDRVWELLSEAGLTAYLVDVGGEVRTRGRRADGRDWSIGVENPEGTGVAEAVPLRNAAIATSGDYRNFFEYEGRRYSHVLDPRSGWPISHELTAVSVISTTTVMADALATALLVLGPETGLELAEREQIAARLVVRSADGLTVLRTPAFEAALAGNRI
ncbi:MAG: FAD:protein FMN transferase [Rhodospirillaceae bacterium]|nr:FAD:protein FMN transferase [Rhodospirillaceae bacterium]